MGFSSKECAWAQTSLKLLGATITGTRGFSFEKEIEKELLYAAGDEAIDITSGNKKPAGSIKILKFEFDKLTDAAQAAGYEDLTEVPHTLIFISCAFKLNANSPIRIIETPLGAAFSKWTIGQEQNAKFTEIELPFIAQRISLRKGVV